VPDIETTERGTPVGRRVVLGMIGLGAVGIAAGKWLSQGVSDVVGSTAPALANVLPAAGGFRIYTVTSGYPEFDLATYRLTVTGHVANELSLSMADLAALPQTGMTKDFQCVTGWRVQDVPWSGVLLKDLLAAAGAEPGATALRFTSFDGAYTESLTMEQGMRPDVLVATSMFGAPIEDQHGAPVRLYVAPMYGYKSIKWLGGIDVGNKVVPGYWEERGYDVDAWIGQSNGRSDDPNV
jgi:DMSO/TMAO reductase YedYZ molybdopterin-dependent catalytic subunit